MRIARVLLVIVAVACFAVALSYPIRYHIAQQKNDNDMEQLARMRQSARQGPEGASESEVAAEAPVSRSDAPGEGAAAPADGDAPAIEANEAVARRPSDENAPEAPMAAPGGTEAVASDEPAAAPGGTEAVASDEPAAAPGGTEAVAFDEPAAAPGGTEPVVHENHVVARGEERKAPPETPVTAPDAREGEGFSADAGAPTPAPEQPAAPTPRPTPTPEPTLEPNYWDLGKYYGVAPELPPGQPQATAEPTPVPTPTPDRSIRKGPLPYALKDKVVLDEAAILPEMREIYALNHDLVGWINIPDTVIDYPVVQAEDSDFYLSHDFYGEENVNGQIILDVLCDPYTPSYNLIVSGHHMKNGSMFGNLPEYRNRGYWEKHKFLEFDTLMARKQYVIFACFYSADYDEDEKGFRYNAVIDYKMDADRWLAEIVENQLYDTGIERAFGDEFITLTTCNRARHRNGRFVVVGRKVREGETFE